jgi:hypothetical protein
MDVFLLRLDATNGGPLACRTYGGPSIDTLASLAVNASGQVAMAGSFSGTVDFAGKSVVGPANVASVYAVSLTPTLTTSWATAMGGNDYNSAGGVSIASTGDVAVTGVFTKTATFGATSLMSKQDSADLFVAKLGPTGSVLWAHQYGGPGPEQVGGVALAPDGSVVMTGGFYDSIDLGAGSAQKGSAYVPLTGTFPPPQNIPTGFAIQLDSSGARVWSKTYGEAGSPIAGVARAGDGSTFIAGSFTGTAVFDGKSFDSVGWSDVFVAKYSP